MIWGILVSLSNLPITYRAAQVRLVVLRRGVPATLLPGLNRASEPDERGEWFSHQSLAIGETEEMIIKLNTSSEYLLFPVVVQEKLDRALISVLRCY